MTSPDKDLRARAERWAGDDIDPATQAELRALLAKPDLASTDVADRFAANLEFGTAGLRGVLGAGPNRMNRAVVVRATWGFAKHLVAAVPGAAERGVVIGYDGRRLSREMAGDAACVLAAAGVRAHLFDDLGPTPLTAFATKKLGAAGGIMVTASHNPPEYNGYKVYWENAAQIIPPVDAHIAAAIDGAPPAREVPRLAFDAAKAAGKIVSVASAVERAYLDAIGALLGRGGDSGDRSLRIAYTALHGVGDRLAMAAFREAGFANVASVPEQARPDGAFPTVAFPNPEEKGAMDLVFALARRERAELVLANDPDADRLAVAVPSDASPTGFVQLTGNDVGVLLGHYLLTTRPRPARPLLVASLVSTPLLGQIAGALGARYDETLTGFKWIANRAMALEREGYTFVFGFEEALGYTVADVVRDKDGISAALVMAEMAAVLRERKRTLLDELRDIHDRYGHFVSGQITVTKKGAEGAREIRALMTELRRSPPARIGPAGVSRVIDQEARTPSANVLVFELETGSRIIARPSGTEPKVKIYFDVKGKSHEDAQAAMHELMQAWGKAL